MFDLVTGPTPMEEVCSGLLRLTYQEMTSLASRIRDVLIEGNDADSAILTTFAVAEAIVTAAEYQRNMGD